MQYVEISGEFDERGQAVISVAIPQAEDIGPVDVFVAAESAELEALEVEGLVEASNPSPVRTLQMAIGLLAPKAQEISLKIGGMPRKAFRSFVGWAKRKGRDEWKKFQENPSCYGCIKMTVWAVKGALASFGIPTLGDGIGNITAELVVQLGKALSTGPIGQFCASWFGDKFINWVTDRAFGDLINRIFGVAFGLHVLAQAICGDIGLCDEADAP